MTIALQPPKNNKNAFASFLFVSLICSLSP